MDEYLKGFEPVVGERACVLVLGSMPSEASLKLGCYYGHPRNRFWPVMAALFPDSADALLSPDFNLRYKALKANGVALWDTIGRCRRTGSLDSAIRDWTPNDVAGLIEKHPGIRTVLLNGKKSEAVWKKSNAEMCLKKQNGLRVLTLPSTSPANAATSLDRLITRWREALGENFQKV